MQSNSNDYLMKFIMIGDIGVGKTSIVSRFINGEFNSNHNITVGVQYAQKRISVANRNIKIQMWDTSGQQSFRSVTRSYYKSCAAALIVFDVTRKDTFRNVVRWVEDVRNNSSRDVVLVLIANKIDLISQRVVNREQGLQLARDHEMLYLQTSAKSQQNIQRAFVWPTNTILERIDTGVLQLNSKNNSITLESQAQRPNQTRKPECGC